MKKLLFIRGSLDLRHVGRGLAIARELRKSQPDHEISWMTESQILNFLCGYL
jgi:hypothetical protein